MSKRNKKTQYEKDRIKAKLVFFLWILSLVAMLVMPIVGCVFNAETGILENKMYMKLSLALFICIPAILFAIGFVICGTIKTEKKKERYSYFEYEIDNVSVLKKLELLGSVKQSKFRECDYYVAFTPKADLFSKNMVVIAQIEVDATYSKEDFNKFIGSITELYAKKRERYNDDYTVYHVEVLVIIFVEKEYCKFVHSFTKNEFYQWRKFRIVSIYDNKNSTVKFRKIDLYNDKIARKYLGKIFSFTTKPKIVIENNINPKSSNKNITTSNQDHNINSKL